MTLDTTVAHRRRRHAPGDASAQFIETKLYPPDLRPGTVSRSGLIQRLDAPGAPVILISAPTGYGKSTLLAEWRSHLAGTAGVAWVSLDGSDHDPVRFMSYLAEAIRRARPAIGAGLTRALRTRNADLHVALGRLTNEVARLDTPIVLILDDYHVIREQRCHDLIAHLMERLPPTMRLALATRTDPTLPLGRLRATGRLTEIRAADLRFSLEDARSLLAMTIGLELDDTDVETLNRRTEGWPAALYLAGLSLRGRDDARAFVDRFAGTHRHLVDYLSEEVLRRQSPELRRFITRVSILDRFCASLCDDVLETAGSVAILDQIERSGLFLVPLDDQQTWYRFHHLLLDVLRVELMRTEPDLAPLLHRRASAWHVAHGTTGEAIHHAIRGDDRQTAAELIVNTRQFQSDLGWHDTVMGWLAAIGEETVAVDPRLALTAAWTAGFAGKPADVERWIDVAIQGSAQWRAPLKRKSIDVEVAFIRAAFGFGGIRQMLAAAAVLAENAADLHPDVRGTATYFVGHALYASGDLAGAWEALSTALRLLPSDYTLDRAYTLANLSLIADDQGRPDEAERLAHEAHRIADEHQLWGHPPSSQIHVAMGRVLRDRGLLSEAQAELEAALALRRKAPFLNPWLTLFTLLTLAPVRFARGDRDGAHAVIEEARTVLDRYTGDAGIFLQWWEHERRLLGRGSPRHTTQVDALTESEITILRLLPSPMTQREIARELYLSVNTIKTHSQSIFRKLGATSRQEAVLKARSLKLL